MIIHVYNHSLCTQYCYSSCMFKKHLYMVSQCINMQPCVCATNKHESVLSIVELVMFRHLLEYWNGWLEYRCSSVYEMGLVPLPLAKGSHVPCVEHISRLTPFTLTLLYMYMLG